MVNRLSIVIPAYKSGKFIKKNLEHFRKTFKKLIPKSVKSLEIICVVDGTSIDNTWTEAKKVKGVKVIGYKENRGKGYALQYGFQHSTGEVITFMDADGDFDPDQLAVFFPYLTTADFIVGSKRHPFSNVSYPFTRQILSRGFQLLSRLVLGIGLRDTQSGLKLIKREMLEVVMPLMVVERFAFDLELCFLAQKHGFRTVEAPVSIHFKGRSTISVGAPAKMFRDMLTIWYRYHISKYYQKKFHETRFQKK